MPIDIEYRLAEVRSAALVVYPDVYRLAERRAGGVAAHIIDALVRAQVDTTGLAVERVPALVRASRRAAVRIPLDSLFGWRASSLPHDHAAVMVSWLCIR